MIAAVIVAAGKGLRMGASQKKQFLHLGREPIVTHTLKVFDNHASVDQIILVIPEEEQTYCRQEVLAPARLHSPLKLISGGRRRQDSVLNGLRSVEDQEAIVLIHDGVRPLTSPALIDACIEGAARYDACIPALPVVDTLKKIGPAGSIQKTIDRQGLYAAQTPQAFKLSLILAAHEAVQDQGGEATDDAALVEATGHPVHLIQGERRNIKITTSEDLAIARLYLQAGQLTA